MRTSGRCSGQSDYLCGSSSGSSAGQTSGWIANRAILTFILYRTLSKGGHSNVNILNACFCTITVLESWLSLCHLFLITQNSIVNSKDDESESRN